MAGFSGTLALQLILCSEQLSRLLVRISGSAETPTLAPATRDRWTPPWSFKSRRSTIIPKADAYENAMRRIITDHNVVLHELRPYKNRSCVICGYRGSHECSYCRVVLHIDPKHDKGFKGSCWDSWHRVRNISSWLAELDNGTPQSVAAASTGGSAISSETGSATSSEGSRVSIRPRIGPRLKMVVGNETCPHDEGDEEEEEELL